MRTPSTPSSESDSYRPIWQLAWPVALSMGAQSLFSVADLFWIGRLGAAAIAAVSICGNVVFCMFGVTMVVQSGALAMVSRRVGAGALSGSDGAEGVAAQALQLGMLLGAFVGVLGAVASGPLLRAFDTSPAVTEVGIAYLVPTMLSFAAGIPSMALAGVFTAAGDTRTPMSVSLFVNLLNAVIDPFLIFGWAGLPAWGVAGAGIASLCCHLIGFALLLGRYRGADLGFPRAPILAAHGTGAWPRMLRIGVPNGLGALTRPLSTLLLLKVIAGFGTAGVAAFGITVRALSLLWICHAALSTAVATLTGQLLGRADLPGVRRLVSHSTRLSILLTAAVGLPYVIGARAVIGLFEQESAAVLDLGSDFLRLLVAANLATAFSIVWSAVMNGAGATRPAMVIALLANWAVKLPLAWLMSLPLGWGVSGIWWAMAVSLVIEAAALWLAYRRVPWMDAQA